MNETTIEGKKLGKPSLLGPAKYLSGYCLVAAGVGFLLTGALCVSGPPGMTWREYVEWLWRARGVGFLVYWLCLIPALCSFPLSVGALVQAVRTMNPAQSAAKACIREAVVTVTATVLSLIASAGSIYWLSQVAKHP